MANRAITKEARRAAREAAAASQEELARRMKAFGPDDPETWTSTNNLAVAYYAANQIRKRPPLTLR